MKPFLSGPSPPAETQVRRWVVGGETWTKSWVTGPVGGGRGLGPKGRASGQPVPGVQTKLFGTPQKVQVVPRRRAGLGVTPVSPLQDHVGPEGCSEVRVEGSVSTVVGTVDESEARCQRRILVLERRLRVEDRRTTGVETRVFLVEESGE